MDDWRKRLGVLIVASALANSVATELFAGGGCSRHMVCDCVSDVDPCAAGCDCCSGPSFAIRAGAAMMDRATPRDAVLIFNPGNTAQNIVAADFNFDFRAGLDVTLVADSIIGNLGVEARYLGIDAWNAGANTSTIGAVTTIINTNPVTTLVGGYNINSNFGSQLHSFEANLRRPMNDWLTVLGGYRQLELGDSLTTNFTGGVADALYDVNTTNQLYGGQIGAEVELLCRDRFRINGIGKAGIFGNNAEHASRLMQGALDETASERTGETSFVGELGFYGVVHLTDCISARVGYQMLWVEQVALATEQFSTTSFITFNGLNTTSGTFYHGALFGIDGTW